MSSNCCLSQLVHIAENRLLARNTETRGNTVCCLTWDRQFILKTIRINRFADFLIYVCTTKGVLP